MSERPPHWGPWVLDKEREILYQESKGPDEDWIDLSVCTDSAQVLDTIIHFSRKFPTDEVAIAGMVRALDDVLEPMATLCSFGNSTKMFREQLSRRIKSCAGPETRFSSDYQ